jgi:hypothetical protein
MLKAHLIADGYFIGVFQHQVYQVALDIPLDLLTLRHMQFVKRNQLICHQLNLYIIILENVIGML